MGQFADGPFGNDVAYDWFATQPSEVQIRSLIERPITVEKEIEADEIDMLIAALGVIAVRCSSLLSHDWGRPDIAALDALDIDPLRDSAQSRVSELQAAVLKDADVFERDYGGVLSRIEEALRAEQEVYRRGEPVRSAYVDPNTLRTTDELLDCRRVIKMSIVDAAQSGDRDLFLKHVADYAIVGIRMSSIVQGEKPMKISPGLLLSDADLFQNSKHVWDAAIERGKGGVESALAPKRRS